MAWLPVARSYFRSWQSLNSLINSPSAMEPATYYRIHKKPQLSVISSLRCGLNEICAVLGFYAALNASLLATFRDKLSIISSRVSHSDSWRWDRWVGPKRRYEITILRCVQSPNSADLSPKTGQRILTKIYLKSVLKLSYQLRLNLSSGRLTLGCSKISLCAVIYSKRNPKETRVKNAVGLSKTIRNERNRLTNFQPLTN